MKFYIASLLLVSLAVSCVADTHKCQQPNGKYIYQNWPCDTKPEIEKKPVAKPDYTAIVKCGAQSGAVNVSRSAVGKKPVTADCSK
ncbi:MAG: hypothetical protein HGA71_15570 [Azonexaceae bacterium]|nr:hypothetical protein [Azonexaceae bacterium]